VLFALRVFYKCVGVGNLLSLEPLKIYTCFLIKQFRVRLQSVCLRLKVQLLLCFNKTGVVFVIEAGVEDPNFAYGLLMELTRAFLAYADNVRAQDSAAYAIQVRYVVNPIFSSPIMSYHTEHRSVQYKCTF